MRHTPAKHKRINTSSKHAHYTTRLTAHHNAHTLTKTKHPKREMPTAQQCHTGLTIQTRKDGVEGTIKNSDSTLYIYKQKIQILHHVLGG